MNSLLETWGNQKQHYPMKKQECKYNYESPMVEVMAARVESGYQSSATQDEGNANTTQYNADSWDTPTPNNGARQYT